MSVWCKLILDEKCSFSSLTEMERLIARNNRIDFFSNLNTEIIVKRWKLTTSCTLLKSLPAMTGMNQKHVFQEIDVNVGRNKTSQHILWPSLKGLLRWNWGFGDVVRKKNGRPIKHSATTWDMEYIVFSMELPMFLNQVIFQLKVYMLVHVLLAYA